MIRPVQLLMLNRAIVYLLALATVLVSYFETNIAFRRWNVIFLYQLLIRISLYVKNKVATKWQNFVS
jgi:hypothetical protein